MSDDEAREPFDADEVEEPKAELDEVDVRDILRRALDEPIERGPSSEVIRGVQRKLREETRGRYFADGWSTSSAPKETYLVTSLLMLALVALAWWLLAPQPF